MSVNVSEKNADRLECMVYHKNIDTATQAKMETLRQNYIWLGELVCDMCPESRSKDLALTSLENSLTRAIQSLAMTGEPDVVLRKV